MDYVLYLALGAVAGLLAGLLGIGGGLVIVPILVLTFRSQQLPAAVLTHLALGTSLATIVVTASGSTFAHHRLGSVRWDLFRWLAPGIMAGVYLGVWTAAHLSGETLQVLIGIYALATAAQMGFGVAPKPSRVLPGGRGLLLIGAVVGAASALFGIGGGSLLVPFLYWCNVRIQNAVGTAAACGLPVAVVGVASNVLAGWKHPELPAGAVGFVLWPAVFCITLVSLPCARWGAELAHRLSAVRLRWAFAVFLALVGVELLGLSLFGG